MNYDQHDRPQDSNHLILQHWDDKSSNAHKKQNIIQRKEYIGLFISAYQMAVVH
jgi:hypothetical protein